MAETVVIRLLAPHRQADVLGDTAHTDDQGSSRGDIEWVTVDSAGARLGPIRNGTLFDAAPQCAGRKTIVLAPGTDVLLAEPVVPLKGGKLIQVIPFALEEQLASDVDAMHFAIGRRDSRPGVPVAVAAHARMQNWLARLREAGVHPDAIYGESAMVPATPNGVTLLIDAARVYVRREGTPGAVLDVEPLIEALQLGLASGEESREHVTIFVSVEDYERERDLLEGLREFTASLQLKLLPDGVLSLLAATAVQTSGAVNLLQGKYAAKRQLNVSFAPWRYAAILAGIFFALHLGLKGWQYTHLQKENARLDAQIAEVYQIAMPGVPVPEASTARRQLEARLNALRGGTSNTGMLATIGTLAEAIGQTPGTNVEALSYRDRTTDLRVLAPSVDALDRIRHFATERGMTATIQSANPRDSKYEGRMQFKSPAS
jgi:general secretion pathway protein L